MSLLHRYDLLSHSTDSTAFLYSNVLEPATILHDDDELINWFSVYIAVVAVKLDKKKCCKIIQCNAISCNKNRIIKMG